jgi:hypothetical protein
MQIGKVNNEGCSLLSRRVASVLHSVEFPDHTWHVTEDGDGVRFHARFFAPCNVNGGDPEEQRTRRWGIRPAASDSEIVATAFKCVLTSLEHEAREQFKYRGRAVFGPHMDVDELWKLAA